MKIEAIYLCLGPSLLLSCTIINQKFQKKLVEMDVFLMVRRKKTTIFLDAKETTTVADLKKMIEGITKKAPAEQQLYNKEDAGRW